MNRLKFRSLIAVVISISLILGLVTGCDRKDKKDKDDGKLKVVTTIFPEYDWTKKILGDKAGDMDLTMLLSNGVDLHSYQPTAKDIKKISNCDVFIYVGGESDEWVNDVLEEANNKDMKVVNLMDILGNSLKEEEVKEGMTAEDEHDDDDDHDHNDDDNRDDHDDKDDDEIEYDEHIWLSLKNAIKCSEAIEKAISEADPANKDMYKKNLEEYKEKLSKLDKEYELTISEAKNKTLVFGDRFPFRYLVDDYNLDYYAAFVGCSAETEASFSTIKFLSDKIDRLGLKHIMKIEKSDKKLAKTIIKNTAKKDADILTLDSMQSTTFDDVKDGADYIDTMKKNLEILKRALN